MPPLLAALLMLEFNCDWRIIQAIDLGVEWRRCLSLDQTRFDVANLWYQGYLGRNFYLRKPRDYLKKPSPTIGTYTWPHLNVYRYKT